MARTKLNPEFEIEVDGELYVWWLQRAPQWSNDSLEWRGMAVGVRHKAGLREAVLEFPPGPRPRYGAPQLKPAQVPTKLVVSGIASAVLAGWEPLSRGKTVTVIVDAAGG
jgi:hypothetical protein